MNWLSWSGEPAEQQACGGKVGKVWKLASRYVRHVHTRAHHKHTRAPQTHTRTPHTLSWLRLVYRVQSNNAIFTHTQVLLSNERIAMMIIARICIRMLEYTYRDMCPCRLASLIVAHVLIEPSTCWCIVLLEHP